jgi:hypothetical protein
MASNKKVRLPRKRKKWLKKFGGIEYYIQAPRKNVVIATEGDFNEIMNAMSVSSNVKWPEYDSFGNVYLSGPDNNGVEWSAVMRADTFHNVLKDVAKKQFDLEKHLKHGK